MCKIKERNRRDKKEEEKRIVRLGHGPTEPR